MLLVVLFSLAVVCVLADDHPTSCGPLQRLMVEHQWDQSHGTADRFEEFWEHVWEDIFDKNPDWRDYYKDVHGDNVMSPEFRAAAARVGADYDILMDVLENDAEVDAQLQHMASKYKPPVTPEGFFPVLGAAIMGEVQDRVGHCFDWDAWHLCTTYLTEQLSQFD